MNREDKSIPKVMHEITFWITFLHREASRCTSADCRLFFNSLTSPFLFDSLKNVVELVDMLNRILNCWNIVHLTWQAFKISLSQSPASYFNDVKIISSLNLPFLTLQNDQKNIPFWSRWSASIVKFSPLETLSVVLHERYAILEQFPICLDQTSRPGWLGKKQKKMAAFNNVLFFCK